MSKRKIFVRILCLAAAAAMMLSVTGCQLAKEEQKEAQSDLMIGALVWAEDSEAPEAPADDSISLKRVETEDGTEIQVSDPDMLGAYVLAEKEDGEVKCIAFQADDRFVSAPGTANVGGTNEIEATLYFDPYKEWCVFLYGVYERSDGSLYAKRSSIGYVIGHGDGEGAGGGNTLEETTGDWGVRVTFHYEPFKAYDKMAVMQFDEEDMCISRTEFAPEDDVQLKKAPGCAYAVCQYIKGSQSDYKIVEDDTVFRVVINPATGIGEKKNIELK